MSNGREHTVPTDILDDLCSRFIINVPEEERTQTNRLMFQVELAHWFYIDFYCTDESNGLQPCGIKQFALHVFHHLPLLRPHLADFEAVLARWREYKLAVPTCGAILLDDSCQHVLLVQGFYSRASWGFPKGKCNESELNELHRCAVREVLEEIGYDISDSLSREDYLEQVVNEQRVRLYLIPGVSRSTKFQPRTRNEIKSIEWFAVSDLPTSQKDVPSRAKLGLSPNSFFMVIPFVRSLKRWIQQRPAAAAVPGGGSGRRRGREKTTDAGHETRGRPQQASSQALQDEPADVASRGGGKGRGGGAKLAVTPQKPAQSASRATRSRAKSQSNSSLNEERPPLADGFSAPSWENFSFDTRKILEALAG